MLRGGCSRAWMALLLLLWLPLAHAQIETRAAAAAEPALEVTLVTVEPGALYWQRFGHNAILVRAPGAARSISYNFGYFDFGQPDFLIRFLRGRMLYQAVALDGDSDIAGYLADGRRVWLQRLRLSPEGARALALHLADHVRPENRDYRYDYYTINCSTKVRDAWTSRLMVHSSAPRNIVLTAGPTGATPEPMRRVCRGFTWAPIWHWAGGGPSAVDVGGGVHPRGTPATDERAQARRRWTRGSQ
jgi:hypothetical protein